MTTNNSINAPIPFAMTQGGTGANLTASLGAVPYSTGTVMALLAATATATQMFQSGSTAAPAWSTSTWPATTTANQILYSSSTNTVAGLSTANNAVLVTNGSGVPSLSTTLPSGIVYQNWVDQASGSVTMAINTGYVSDDGASLVTYTLPTTAALGSIFEIVGKGSGLWKIIYTTGQSIIMGNQATTTTTGNLASTLTSDCVRIVCTTANTTFTVTSAVGNLTVT